MHPRVSHCIPCRLTAPPAPAPAPAEARVIYGAVCCKTDWARHRLWQQSKWRERHSKQRRRQRGERVAVSRWGEVGQMICNALILRIITQIEIVEWQSKNLLLFFLSLSFLFGIVIAFSALIAALANETLNNRWGNNNNKLNSSCNLKLQLARRLQVCPVHTHILWHVIVIDKQINVS